MNLWFQRYNDWVGAFKAHFPDTALRALAPQSEIARPTDVWTQLGDDAKCFEVVDFMGAFDSPLQIGFRKEPLEAALPSDIPALEHAYAGLKELSCDRLLDAFRQLLHENRGDLFPVSAFIDTLQKQKVLRTKKGGGVQLVLPLTEKGRERLLKAMTEPITVFATHLVENHISALLTRADRFRRDVLCGPFANRTGLLLVLDYFDRVEKKTSRDIITSAMQILPKMLEYLLQQCPETAPELSDYEYFLNRFWGEAAWPVTTAELLEKGFFFQAVFMGMYIHLGMVTAHVLKNCRLWMDWRLEQPQLDLKEGLA
jgi:hypothetical protein